MPNTFDQAAHAPEAPLATGAAAEERGLVGLSATGSTLAAVLGVALSVTFTWALVGIPCFAASVGGITVAFAHRAFRAPPRRSLAPYLVAGTLYVLALVVGIALVVRLKGGEVLYGVLPSTYLLLGWVAAPALFFAVLSLDPRAPESLSARIALAFSLTERVRARHRAAALLASAVALFAPIEWAASHHRSAWPIGLLWVGVSTYPVLASALLVRTYARVRPALAEERAAPLPTAPGHLRVHAGLALALTGFAVPVASQGTWVALVLALGLALQTFQELARAHQLGRLETLSPHAPPGRRAFTGRLTKLTPEAGVLEGGGMSITFARPLRTRGTPCLGEAATLVATFEPPTEGFRATARRDAPADATLYAGALPSVLRTRVRRALLIAHGACAAVATVAGQALL